MIDADFTMASHTMFQMMKENDPDAFQFESDVGSRVDLLQVFVLVSISNQNIQIKIENLQEFIIPQAIWSMGDSL